jgi:hypothetical protein
MQADEQQILKEITKTLDKAYDGIRELRAAVKFGVVTIPTPPKDLYVNPEHGKLLDASFISEQFESYENRTMMMLMLLKTLQALHQCEHEEES